MGKKESEWIFSQNHKISGVPGIFDDQDFTDLMSGAVYLKELLEFSTEGEDRMAKTEEFDQVLSGTVKEGEQKLKTKAILLISKLKPILEKQNNDPQCIEGDVLECANDFIDYLDRLIKPPASIEKGKVNNKEAAQAPNASKVKGFISGLPNTQIESLHRKMGKYWEATPEEFIALLSQGMLADSSKGIKWKIKNKDGNPHKGALGEFFDLLSIKRDKKIFLAFITDKEGNPLNPSNRSGKEASLHYGNMKEIINSVISPT